ncbi:MAG: DNA-processing protein DprA [Firmicutes bacterium]|nr:DNA-processing protein DprA [Bacillota bacterium]
MEYTTEERACIEMSREQNTEARKKMATAFVDGRWREILAAATNDVPLDTFITNMNSMNIFCVTRFSKTYPLSLLNLEVPPVNLYCRGNVELFRKPCVAMVGTRDCTRYGTEVAAKFAREFVNNGLVVVSGLAEGIDAASHLGAFPSGKVVVLPDDTILNTIAVLGNGINYYYPKSNTALQNAIAKHGLLVSEYPPNTPSERYNFPFRNRIVAALSKAVVIVEADLKSGTMITRDWALDLGIDVFAVPGMITSYASRGTNAIIREAACTICTSVEDVLETFAIYMKDKGQENTVRQITLEEQGIIAAMKSDEVHFDELCETMGLHPKKLTTLLTKMEISGLIKKLPGNFFACAI